MALKDRIRGGIPKTLVAALGLAWLWMTWLAHTGQVVRAGEIDTEVVLRYYDRSMRFSEAVERGDAFGNWMAGATEEEESEWLEETRETVRDLYLGDLGRPGEILLDAISLRLGEGVTHVEGTRDPTYREEMREWLLEGNGSAWDFELFLDQENDPAVLLRYREENDRLLARAIWSGSIDNVILIIGLGIGAYCLFWRERDSVRLSRVPDSWAASSVLGAFFLAELLLDPWLSILDSAYYAYYALGGILDIYLPYDALWRAFPAVVVAIVFLKNPARIRRVFAPGRRIDWPLLIAALAVMDALHWVLYFITPGTETDPTDFIETTSPDAWLLVSLFVSSVLFAPVFEEIAFRGFLFQGLKSKTGVFGAAVISSLLFAFVHTQYDFWGWISVGAMGMAACYLTYRTGSLKTGIVFHGIGNLLISADVYLFYQLPL